MMFRSDDDFASKLQCNGLFTFKDSDFDSDPDSDPISGNVNIQVAAKYHKQLQNQDFTMTQILHPA